MFKVKIYSVGKNKENWLNRAILEYEKRLQSQVKFLWHLFNNEKELEKELEKNVSKTVFLDPNGTALDSVSFHDYLFNFFQKNKLEISFAIGSDRGFSLKIKERVKNYLSLSKMTFTHQLTRLLLIEQIYRSFEISKNSNYHK